MQQQELYKGLRCRKADKRPKIYDLLNAFKIWESYYHYKQFIKANF